MAIDKLPPGFGNSSPLTGSNKYKSPASADATAGSHSTPVGQDAVILTPQARRLSQVQQSLATAPAPDNSARLDALKQAINDGSYWVDSERLAASLSRFEQDLESI